MVKWPTVLGLAASVGVAAGGVALWRRARTQLPGEPSADDIFSLFLPGGPQGYWCNGPVGQLTARLMPIIEAGTYRTVASMLDLRPDDHLLDIGCGPGGFLAAQASHVHRVVGIDASPLMLRTAKRRLADRIAAGTAQLVQGNAAALPFDDHEFSAAVAIYAPASPAEVFRVLRPGGRFVVADPEPARTPAGPAASRASQRWGEADYRRMLEDAGFTDLVIHIDRGGLYASGRKPPTSTRSAEAQHEHDHPEPAHQGTT